MSIAIAAALAVEPCSTGLGGDMFCLFYDNETRKVSCINGSGKSPESLTWERVQEAYPKKDEGGNEPTDKAIDANLFRDSPLAVTIPGTAQGWEDLFDRHGSGKFTMSQLFEPAIHLAEEGFPVAPVTAYHWRAGMSQITKWLKNDGGLDKIPLTTSDGKAPQAGDIVTNPDMARVLRDLGVYGA